MSISQIAGLFLNPLFWILFLVVLGLLLRKRKAGPRILLVSVILFYFFSNRFVVDSLVRGWEENLSPPPDSVIFDAAIVLGGSVVTFDKQAQRLIFRENGDKMLQAIALYQTGSINGCMLSGGPGSLKTVDKHEASFMRMYLLSIGVPDSVIHVDSVSDNTHENAVNSAAQLKYAYPGGRFLLITTALHMKRAIACFRKQGLQVEPYPVSKITGQKRTDIEYLLIPQTESFIHWRNLLHEVVGYWMYRVRGYC